MAHVLPLDRFRHRLALFTIMGIAALICLLAGCKQHTLETGYEYQPLNSSLTERRAFYADPYSLAARRAEQEQQNDNPNPAFDRFGR